MSQATLQTSPPATSSASSSAATELRVRGVGDDLFGRIADRIERIAPGRILSLTFEAPAVPAERLFENAAVVGVEVADHGFLWHPPNGSAFAGIGVCSRLQIDGGRRFSELRTQAGRIFSRLDHAEIGEVVRRPARFFGGLAFDAGAADLAPWQDFGNGCFTLPRWLYRRQGDSADLTLTLQADEAHAAGAEEWATRARALVHGMDAAGVGPRVVERGGFPQIAPDADGDAAWIQLVSDIRQAIRGGEVEKIVAARRFRVELPFRRSLGRTLSRLGQHRRPSIRFAFSRPGATFVGLTPEKLVAKRGMRLETEALAGSIESGDEHAAALLGSGKDRLEQQLVVDSIVRRLEPLCSRLEVAERPSVRELRDVLHLHTPIVGTLEEPRHVLDLAELLHPTPAVGGVPTEAAMEWIRGREAHPRGWYASPIGWFDESGDGELAVALRSCLLQPERAYLYAGAGIVADSDPVRELHEVELKLQTLLQALSG
ncbi:MAG: isochorismate synthase [Acidobacteriota bacterium]